MGSMRLHVELPESENLEAQGRRMTLFARLVDEAPVFAPVIHDTPSVGVRGSEEIEGAPEIASVWRGELRVRYCSRLSALSARSSATQFPDRPTEPRAHRYQSSELPSQRSISPFSARRTIATQGQRLRLTGPL